MRDALAREHVRLATTYAFNPRLEFLISDQRDSAFEILVAADARKRARLTVSRGGVLLHISAQQLELRLTRVLKCGAKAPVGGRVRCQPREVTERCQRAHFGGPFAG